VCFLFLFNRIPVPAFFLFVFGCGSVVVPSLHLPSLGPPFSFSISCEIQPMSTPMTQLRPPLFSNVTEGFTVSPSLPRIFCPGFFFPFPFRRRKILPLWVSSSLSSLKKKAILLPQALFFLLFFSLPLQWSLQPRFSCFQWTTPCDFLSFLSFLIPFLFQPV